MLSCHQRVTDEDRIPDLVCEGILDLVAQNFTAEKLVRPQTIFLSLMLLFCQYFAFPCRFCTDREISLSSSAGHLNQFKHQYQSGAVKINVQLTFCVLFQATRPWMMKGQPSICRSKFLQTLIFINASMTREAAQIMDSVKSQWKEKNLYFDSGKDYRKFVTQLYPRKQSSNELNVALLGYFFLCQNLLT